MVSTHSENSQQLIGLARRRAFELYLRSGRKPDAPLLAERKDIGSALAAAAADRGMPTSHYVWRTMLDDRVRRRHIEREGHVFARAEPPSGGPPGTEPNCRCWAEPYYGDPAIPDALQPLAHAYQTDTTGLAPWASIETLTRADGSIAHSVVLARDGTQIQSAFSGTLIARQITLATGEVVRVDTSGGVQSIYLGSDPRPLFQSAWTAHGPRVIRARRHLAFLGDEQTLIDPDVEGDPYASAREPYGIPILPNLGGLIALALVSLHSMLRAAPASQGLGEKDEPVLAIKAWAVNGNRQPVPVLVGSLTEEQLRQHCRFLPDVQNWTDDAAALLADKKPILPERTWGSLVHGVIKRTIDALKKSSPFIYDSLRPEISFAPNITGPVPYGRKGSTRLDVVEDRSEEEGVLCDYDVKTGREGLTVSRLKEIADRLSKSYPGITIYIIEVRPRL
ncbi:MAG: hypothetical protein KKF33_05585 [Alphaproteobacteria bacterium]|nr:hypothetical protein [Alphaproteobacteria bacterium]